MFAISRAAVAGLCATALLAGCASAPPHVAGAANQPIPDSHYRYTDADIDFMAGMIPHHAQAVTMAGWCGSHGARKDLVILCERMVVAQRDEIALLQQWLRDRALPVPDAASTRHRHRLPNGTEHDMLMPGMLTDEEMAALDRARGAEFDRLFLIGMIKHHQGAIDMVDVLLRSHGAAQDETVFKFANDVQVDQEIEINVMKDMLEQVVKSHDANERSEWNTEEEITL